MLDSRHIHDDWVHFFDTVHSDNDWITPLLDAVAGIGVEEASWKPASAMPSIWEIVAHASGHLEALLLDLNAVDVFDYADWPAVDSGNAAEWEATTGKLVEQIARLQRQVRGFSVEDLYESAGSRRRVSQRLTSIFVHNAYHAGQIVKLRQLFSASREMAVAI